MTLLTLLVIGLAHASDCETLGEQDCLFSGDKQCRWYPISLKCYNTCASYANESYCNSSLCSWLHGVCSLSDVPCEAAPVVACDGRCGVVMGSTTCLSCSSATSVSSCMTLSDCVWNGTACGAQQFCSDPTKNTNSAACTADPQCYWVNSGLGYCKPKAFAPWCGIGNTLTTQCTDWQGSSPDICSGLSIEECVWKADCKVHRSNECVAIDRCDKAATCADYPGCWLSTNGLCTAQADVCKNVPQDQCSDIAACVWQNDACLLYSGCRTLRSEQSCFAKGCVVVTINNNIVACDYSLSLSVCTSLTFTCDGEACSGLLTSPPVASYHISGGQYIDEAYAGDIGGHMHLINGDQYCVDCDVCQPGHVFNKRVAFVCNSDSYVGSFSDNICVVPGNYPDPNSPPGGSDDDHPRPVVIVLIVAAVVLIASLIAAGLVYLATKRKNASNFMPRDQTLATN